MRWFKRVLIGLVVLVGLVIGWGLAEPYFIDVEEYQVEIPGLPPAWEGQRFAQVSDWQTGMWLDNERTVRRAVERIVQERPAFALITGDFIYHAGDHPDRTIEKVVGFAEALPAAGIPTFAVLGNHDYAMKSKEGQADEALALRLAEALEAAGIDVLENESRGLTPGGEASQDTASAERLYVVGIGANWPGHDQAEAAVATVPEDAARVVMMHNPNSYEALPAGTAPLAVAGHTHGGQISIPFTPDWSYLTFAKSDVHADGWVERDYGAAGNRLYVNRGIGFSTVPLRIHCQPEVTLFTLASAPV